MAIGYSWPVERVDISKALAVYPNEDLLLQPASYRSVFKKEQLLDIKEASKKREVRSVHIKPYGWADADEKSAEELTGELQHIEEILPGVETIVTHPPIAIFADAYQNIFRRYIGILSRAVNNTDNIRIAIENMRSANTMCSPERIRYVRKLLDRSQEPRIGFAIDTSHLHLRNRKKMSRRDANMRTFNEFYEEAGKERVFQLHISDPKHSALSDRHFDWNDIIAGEKTVLIDKIMEVKTPEELKSSVEYLKENKFI